MAATTIIMAILGCGDAGTVCQPVGVAPVAYESVSACVAAQDDVLASMDVMFPVVTAQCRRAGEAKAADRTKAPEPAAKPARVRAGVRVAALRG